MLIWLSEILKNFLLVRNLILQFIGLSKYLQNKRERDDNDDKDNNKNKK